MKSWTGIVEGKSLALRWRPGIVTIGGEPTIAVSRGPYILQTMKDGVAAGASACSRRSGCAIRRMPSGASSSTAARPPDRASTIAPPPIVGSRSSRCRTARCDGGAAPPSAGRLKPAVAPSGAGAQRRGGSAPQARITPLLKHAAIGAAEGGIERQAVARQQHVDRAVERRGRARERLALRRDLAARGREAVAQGRRQRAALGGVGELADRARERAMQLGGVQVDPGRVARAQGVAEGDETGLDRGEARLRAPARARRWSPGRRHHPCTLVRSSCALAISLSAIASGLILKVPSAIARTDAGDLVGVELGRGPAREQGRGGARQGDRRAGVDRRRGGLAVAGARRSSRRRLARRGRAGGGCRQRLVSGMSDLHGALQGAPARAGTVVMDGLSARRDDDFRAFCHPGPPRSEGQLDPPLAGRQAGDDVAALGANPRRLAFDAVGHAPGRAFEREAVAGGDQLDGLAGGEPLAQLDVSLAHRLAGPQRLRERAAGDELLVEEGRRRLLGEIDLGFVEIGSPGRRCRRWRPPGTTSARPQTLTVIGR